MKIRNILWALIPLLGLITSCDVERLPHDSIDASSITNDPGSSMDNLLRGAYAQLKSWSDVMHRCGEYAGDNIMIRGSSTDAFYEFISFQRTPQNYRLNGFWNSSYKAIAQTSNIINMVQEGGSPEVDQKLGECYFVRGLMYFYLVRAYGRPYYDNPTKNLGVPIVNGTQEDVFAQLPDRSTVAETYTQAIKDLEKSITLMDASTSSSSPAYASKEAAEAILSRIYLFMSGTYDNPNREYAQKSLEYAEKVINSGRYELLPREEFMKYNTMVPENNKESIFVVKRLATEFSGWDHYYGVGGMYANIGGMGWGEMYASGRYLELLDETGRNDWANGKLVDARAAFIEPQYKGFTDDLKVFRVIVDNKDKNGAQTGYAYLQLGFAEGSTTQVVEKVGDTTHTYDLVAVDAEQGQYKINYRDGKTYQGVIDYEIKLNRAFPMFYITKCSREGEESHLHSPVISRLGEIYLNLAEAAAKLGQYEKARVALNTIRERSLPGEGYATLGADDAEERIEKERQLELAFQAERSYDVFRNGRALKRHYPGPHSAMEDIPASDYRVVYFIPQDAINAYMTSGSTLTQNPRSN
ncbi:MAG: RagB/SusD family nutrient uptake outer membrane protein [Porphyromonas sp.]|nr:RagB/SusD family nutrient uptake outer membrane protein [Porphyromonas sp.]